MPELHRPDEPEQIVPVVRDQLRLDGLGKQRTGVRVAGAPGRPDAEAVELQAADVADARRELQAGQIEDRKGGQVWPAVSVVCSAIGSSVGLPKISSRTATASRHVVGMTLVP